MGEGIGTKGEGSWTNGAHFLANRRKPAMASPAITASSPRIRAAMGNVAGCAGWAGWPVAARSEVAGWLAAVEAATLVDGAAVAAGASGAVCTSITRRVGPLSSRTRMHAGVDSPTP